MPYLYKQTYLEVVSDPAPRVTLEGEKFTTEDVKKGYRYEWTDLDQQYKPKSLWLAWQRDVQIASRACGTVPQHVLDYYQDTKHLSKPPVAGDKSLLGKPLQIVKEPEMELREPFELSTYPGIIERVTVTREEIREMIKPPSEATKILAQQAAETLSHIKQSQENLTKPFKPLFATSYTGMTTFMQCPAKWAAEKWFKTVPYEEGEAQKWGNRVHLALENTLKGTPTPADRQLLVDNGWEKYPQLMLQARNSGAELFVEKELCVTQNLEPCGWKDWDTVWFRNKADVLIKKLQTLKYFDWKTGKRKEDVFQVEVTWAIAAQHFPDVETFDGKLIYLSDPSPVFSLPRPLTRDDLASIWERIHAIHDRMLKAVQSGVFQERSSGLCKNYCGNTSCIHCGGSR